MLADGGLWLRDFQKRARAALPSKIDEETCADAED